nr:helix-turn-helix domain-containing protein [Thermus thermophilus]
MTVADHLTLNELWRRVKKAKDPIEKHRFLAVYHAKRGLTAKEIAKITLSSIRWVQETVRRYNREGPEGLRDKRHQNPGQKPKLTPEEQRRVLEALQGPHPTGPVDGAQAQGLGGAGAGEEALPLPHLPPPPRDGVRLAGAPSPARQGGRGGAGGV